jgi:predicted hotdog family 3-hydroxylacyl-ACP dehydratase
MHWLPSTAMASDAVHVTVPADHPFARDGHLLPSALIEYLAQAAAARISVDTQGRRLKQGVLVAIADLMVHELVPLGTPLKMLVTPTKSFGPFTAAHLEARRNDTLVARANMTFHLTFE